MLDGVTTRADCPFAFPSPRGDGPYLGLRNAFRHIVSRKPELDGVTPHTLRHSFASTAAELGFTELTVAALIGHRTGTVSARYVHQLDAVLLTAADRVAAQIEAWMQGNEPAEIVELSEHVSFAGSRSAGIGRQGATIVTIRP